MYFAIRQISTGHYFPQHSKGMSHTHSEPSAGAMPRLFKAEHYAKSALNHWLKGRVTVTTHYSGNPFEEDITEDFKIEPVPERDPADYEVVEVILTPHSSEQLWDGKKILLLDFDGVLHNYTSGWKGAHIVSDPPVPGALDFLQQAVHNFKVHIFSSRSHQKGGIEGMRNWLLKHSDNAPWVKLIHFTNVKSTAHVFIDDRALTFTGKWPTMKELHAFRPWNKLTIDKPKE